jgi:pimeloyl-ACP methyl ester carboxylesterase/DNA-binding SARP family transcriptional activator
LYLTTVDSADIHYTCSEPGADTAETILFVHGLGLDLTTWDWIVPYFQPRYRVVLYDLRGHGKSGMGTEELDWELLCQDICSLVSELNLDHVHIVGHGLGGNLALLFALRYPSLVRSIVLIGTTCFYPKAIMDKHISFRRQLIQNDSILPLANELIKKICHPLNSRKRKLLLGAYQKVSPATYLAYLELGAGMLNSQIVSLVEPPVLVLAGQNDPLYPPDVLIIGASFLPHSQFLVVPSASNTIQLDQPKLAAEWIEGFYRRLRQKPVIEETTADWFGRLAGELRGQIRQVFSHGHKKVNTERELRIEMLHTFRVLINGEEVHGSWNQRHAKEIMAYLAVHKTATREQLCDLFWPDLHIRNAKNNVRVALSHLKNLLQQKEPGGQGDQPYLLIDREEVRLQGRVSCDLVELKEKLDQIANEQDESIKLVLAKKLLGELPSGFLTGFYDDWTLEIREQLENRIVELCMWIADCCERQESFTEGITYLNIALRYHSNDARIYDRIIELYKRNKLGTLS